MKPNRPPDSSTLLEFPSDEMLERVRAMAQTSDDPDIRLLAAIIGKLCPTVEAIAKALPGVARGDIFTVEPDV